MTAIVVAIVRAISLASLQARERRSKHDGDPFDNAGAHPDCVYVVTNKCEPVKECE